jgi:hypothetical protein
LPTIKQECNSPISHHKWEVSILVIKEIQEAEIKFIEDLIIRIENDEKILKDPGYICEKVIEMFGDPYNYPCWNCSRPKMGRVMIRCSNVRFGARVGKKYSELFNMTGLEILEQTKKEAIEWK